MDGLSAIMAMGGIITARNHGVPHHKKQQIQIMSNAHSAMRYIIHGLILLPRTNPFNSPSNGSPNPRDQIMGMATCPKQANASLPVLSPLSRESMTGPMLYVLGNANRNTIRTEIEPQDWAEMWVLSYSLIPHMIQPL